MFIAELAGLPFEDMPFENSIEPGGYWKYVVWEGSDNTRHRVLVGDTVARIYFPYDEAQREIIANHWHLLSDDVKNTDWF